MVTFLCGLEPNQWVYIHQFQPSGSASAEPEGYERAGLYEGRHALYIIQKSADSWRYWEYLDLFEVDTESVQFRAMIELAQASLEESRLLRAESERMKERAESLDHSAMSAYNRAFFPDEL